MRKKVRRILEEEGVVRFSRFMGVLSQEDIVKRKVGKVWKKKKEFYHHYRCHFKLPLPFPFDVAVSALNLSF